MLRKQALSRVSRELDLRRMIQRLSHSAFLFIFWLRLAVLSAICSTPTPSHLTLMYHMSGLFLHSDEAEPIDGLSSSEDNDDAEKINGELQAAARKVKFLSAQMIIFNAARNMNYLSALRETKRLMKLFALNSGKKKKKNAEEDSAESKDCSIERSNDE